VTGIELSGPNLISKVIQKQEIWMRGSVIAPSGEQITITDTVQHAVVVEVGGGFRSYSVRGRECVDGYSADEMCSSGRGQVLIPWPNRLQDGSYEFDGRRHQLPLNEPERRNAIHGLVRWAAWTVAEQQPHRVVMKHVPYPQPGYPFTLGINVEYALSDSGIRVRTTATNLGADPCPYGSGAHPYLALGTVSIDGLTLRVPGRSVLQSDERGLPVALESVEGAEYDFQQARPCVHRPHARSGRPSSSGAPRSGPRHAPLALGRPELSVLDDFQWRLCERQSP
jgi:aldose 1-epimerase